MAMSWLLLAQIIVIMMFGGLVAGFIVSVYFTQKDNSWAKRINAFGAMFKDMANNQTNAKMKALDEMLEMFKQNKEKKE